MKNFIRNWDMKRQIAAVTMFYSLVALIGNSFFKKNNLNLKISKHNCPVGVCKNIPKKQKIFNGIVLGCFVVDLAGSYCLLKGLKKVVRQ